MKKSLSIIIIALICSFVAAQQHPVVKSRLVTDTIMLGDQVVMEVDIAKDIAAEIQIPQFEKGVLTDKVEILGTPRIDTISRDGRNVTVRLTYTLTSFDAGIYQIAGFPIVVEGRGMNDTVRSAGMMQLVVQTFDIDTTKMQIADIKQPLGTPITWAEIKDVVLWSLAGALLLAVVIYFVIRFVKSRRREVTAKLNEPPHITAIRELMKVHSEKLPQAGKYKEYYSRVTDTLRTYIESRYEIGAMEMTTPEIIASLDEVNDDKLINKLRELFSLADLVKFAKWTPTIEECEEGYQTAYYYVEQTKIIIVNPETPAEQDA
ncbi:hypothetical protein BN938_0153 [Mucinivorans hirudinis]|uniref:BatD n=1 Tax=Mucinivorans hirudinis TaxID=1433126 RepID=A0A060RA25_9BACT|nr:hypothetical protein BN938_0153 [Mucinivorans hirudinis]